MRIQVTCPVFDWINTKTKGKRKGEKRDCSGSMCAPSFVV